MVYNQAVRSLRVQKELLRLNSSLRQAALDQTSPESCGFPPGSALIPHVGGSKNSTPMGMCTCTYVCICTCICICIYMYIHVYTHNIDWDVVLVPQSKTRRNSKSLTVVSRSTVILPLTSFPSTCRSFIDSTDGCQLQASFPRILTRFVKSRL